MTEQRTTGPGTGYQTVSKKPGYQVVRRNGAPWPDSLVSGISSGLMYFLLVTDLNWAFSAVLILTLLWSVFISRKRPNSYDVKRTNAVKTTVGYSVLFLLLILLFFMIISSGVPTFAFALATGIVLGLSLIIVSKLLLPSNYEEPIS